MIPLFWAFMNDIVRADEAKRIYGIVGLGAVVGGFLGNTYVRANVEDVGREPLLLFLIIPVVVIAVIAVLLLRRGGAEERHRYGYGISLGVAEQRWRDPVRGATATGQLSSGDNGRRRLLLVQCR